MVNAVSSSSGNSPSFCVSLPQALLHALEREQSTVYALDAALRMVYVNPAWTAFANANGGEKLLEEFQLGGRIDRYFSPPLRSFYVDKLANVLRTGRPLSHFYECPSPTMRRAFRMRAYRADPGPFLIVTNDLVLEEPADPAAGAHELPPRDGIVVQCSHCRRVRARASTTWVWAPAYVASPPPLLSHGLCPPCTAYFYPEP